MYIPDFNIKFASGVHNNMRNRPLGLENDSETILIVSDSMSALQKFSSTHTNNIDWIAGSIKRLIFYFKLECNVAILWVPSGLEGNEMANMLADIGRGLNVPYEGLVDKLEENYARIIKRM